MIGNEPLEPRPSNKRRTAFSLLLRITVTVCALAWTASRVSFDELARAFLRIDVSAAALAVTLTYVNLLVGAARWRLLLRAYGAHLVPSWARLSHAYLIALFYNTFLPANIAGDALRAHATRQAFERASGAYVVVMVERAFGLAGLLFLGAATTMIRPPFGAPALRWLGVMAVSAAIAAAAAPVVARRVGSFLSRRTEAEPDGKAVSFVGRVAHFLVALPSVRTPSLLTAVLALSVCTQLLVALSGHLLLASVAPDVPLATSLVLVPLALIAIYFPTVAGLGVREAAFVVLFGKVGVSAEDATAASLSLMAVQLAVALTGGAVHLIAPLRMGSTEPTETNGSKEGTL